METLCDLKAETKNNNNIINNQDEHAIKEAICAQAHRDQGNAPGCRQGRVTASKSDEEELQRLNAAFHEVKKLSGPQSELHYRSAEYRALQKHRRAMKRQQIPIGKEKKKKQKSRKDWDAKYYQSKKQRIEEMNMEKKKAADENLDGLQRAQG